MARLPKGRKQNQSVQDMEARDGVFHRQTQIRPGRRRRLSERMEMSCCIGQNVSTSWAYGSFRLGLPSRQDVAAEDYFDSVWAHLFVACALPYATTAVVICVRCSAAGNVRIFGIVRLNWQKFLSRVATLLGPSVRRRRRKVKVSPVTANAAKSFRVARDTPCPLLRPFEDQRSNGDFLFCCCVMALKYEERHSRHLVY